MKTKVYLKLNFEYDRLADEIVDGDFFNVEKLGSVKPYVLVEAVEKRKMSYRKG